MAASIVSIAFNIEDVGFTSGRLAKILLRQIPYASVLVFLDSDYETLVQRRGRLVEPRQYINFQKRCYRVLGEKVESTYVDTSSKTIEQTSKLIMNIIRDRKHGGMYEEA